MALFCVCDGHGKYGEEMAHYALRDIVKGLSKNAVQNGGLGNDDGVTFEAMKKVFLDVDAALKDKATFDTDYSGTTATVILYCYNPEDENSHCYVAWVGDSRAVRGFKQDGEWTSQDLSIDHKPDREDERKRIEGMRGFVSERAGEHRDVERKTITGTPVVFSFHSLTHEERRKAAAKAAAEAAAEAEGAPLRVWIDRELTLYGKAMSRSIGDHAALPIGVIAEPEVEKVLFGAKEEGFIVLASHNVWKFMKSDEVVQFCGESLDQQPSFDVSVTELVKTAAAKGAAVKWLPKEGDNRNDITAIMFRTGPMLFNSG